MRKFVVNFTLWEANSDNNFVRDIDYCSYFCIYLFTFLMELVLRLLHFHLITTNEERCDVIAVRELPVFCMILLWSHHLEFFNQRVWFTCLWEYISEKLSEFISEIGIRLYVNAQEYWNFALFLLLERLRRLLFAQIKYCAWIVRVLFFQWLLLFLVVFSFWVLLRLLLLLLLLRLLSLLRPNQNLFDLVNGLRSDLVDIYELTEQLVMLLECFD